MRIDLNPGSGVEPAESAKPDLRCSSAAAKATNTDVKPAEFQNSIGKLAESALNSPEIRQAKVEALKAQLDAGTYHVSPQQIASAVLEQLRVRP